MNITLPCCITEGYYIFGMLNPDQGLAWSLRSATFNFLVASSDNPNGYGVGFDQEAGTMTVSGPDSFMLGLFGTPNQNAVATIYPGGWKTSGLKPIYKLTITGSQITALQTASNPEPLSFPLHVIKPTDDKTVHIRFNGYGGHNAYCWVPTNIPAGEGYFNLGLPGDFDYSTFTIDWGDGDSETFAPAQEIRTQASVSYPPNVVFRDVHYLARETSNHSKTFTTTGNGKISVNATWVGPNLYPLAGLEYACIPRAFLTVEWVKDRTVRVSGLDSWDIDGTIVDYAWNWGGAGVQSGTGHTVEFTYDHYGPKSIQLTITDNDGLTDVTSITINGIDYPGAATLDTHGRIWATAPATESANTLMRCYWHHSKTSKFDEASSLIHFSDGDGSTGILPMTLWHDQAGRLWGLFYGGYLGYNYSEFNTYNDGETDITELLFQGVFVNPNSEFGGEATVLEGDIRGVAGCALAEGGMAVCGVDFVSNEIKFRVSFDGEGVSWGDVSTVATLADASSFDLALFQFSVIGSSQLVILHINSGRRWTSSNYGSSWTAATT